MDQFLQGPKLKRAIFAGTSAIFKPNSTDFIPKKIHWILKLQIKKYT